MKTQFYMILPSNSSMSVFPDNTTSCFTTKLPQEVNLRGSWEVGIAEIHFPRSFLHLRKSEREITVINKTPPVFRDAYGDSLPEETEEYLKTPYGLYINIMQFVEVLNETLKETHIEFHFSQERNNTYVCVVRKCNPQLCNFEHKLLLSRAVLDILGFAEIKDYLNVDYEPCFATRPANILNATPKQLYIYSNICEPCIVDDVQASLLRIVPVNYKDYVFASNQYQICAPINYIPLIRNSFRTIVIDIRDHLGNFIPFECGTSTVTLHLRQAN